eukprot:PhF_6_TR3439/c0_g1_i3/m.5011/K20862/yigB; FMN hydrolase / 5-amino-6-(5-phospho-D-ribitylamino)uracil phosphatase
MQTTAMRRLVTIDLDDTLWDISGTIMRAEQRISQYAGNFLGSSYPQVQDLLDPTNPKGVENKTQVYESRTDLVTKCHMSELRKEIFRSAVRQAGMDEAQQVEDTVAHLYAAYYNHRNDVMWFDNAVQVLQTITETMGCTLVAITNGNANLSLVGVQHLFANHVHAMMPGMQPKPHRSMFDAVLEMFPLEVAGHVAIHVGDDPVRDVDAAKAVGFRTVWINVLQKPWPAELIRADAEVTELKDLPAVLERLFGETQK